jgi:chaperonin cofactor prefoldin
MTPMSEYARQSKLLQSLRDKYKEVALSETKENLLELELQIKVLDSKLKKIDSMIDKLHAPVGNYKSSLNIKR